MKIKWLGHSCFLITADNDVRILTDPFDDSVGYPLPEVAADIVSTSHGHFDHNYIQVVQGEFFHVQGTGRFSYRGIEITGVGAFHDQEQGAQRGENTLYKYTVDGLNVCHCGDLGHVLTAQQVEEIGPVDILLIPVGGFYTIGAEEATAVIALLKPSVIIPMHFKTEAIQFTIAGVEPFLAKQAQCQRVGKQEIELTKETLPASPTVLVLEYA